MMVNCPKCGFSQPQDQYCARCGVDMISFKPIQKPILEKLVQSTTFQIAALALIVVTVFSFARQSHRRELAERQADIENAQNSQVVVNRANGATKSEFSSASAATAPAASAQAAGIAPTLPQNPTAGAAPATSASGGAPVSPASFDATNSAPITNNPEGGAGSAAVGKSAANLSISFAEMPRASAAELINAADRRNSQLQGSFNIGVMPSMSAKLRALAGVETLDSTTRGIKQGETIEFYGGQREETTGQFLGYVVEAIPSQLDENETHLQVRIFRYLREASGQVEEFAVPMPDQLNIPRGGGAFISGSYLLPRRPSEQDRRFYDPIKVLHVLAKDEFVKGLSDFVILIEPR